MAGTNTLAIIKPKAVENGNIGAILHTINAAGFQIKGLKMLRLTRKQAEEFFAAHKKSEIFQNLVEFMSSGPIVVAAIYGEDAVEQFRSLMGATDPKLAGPETIRGKFGTNATMNAIHGSESDEIAKKEIEFMFKPEELFF